MVSEKSPFGAGRSASLETTLRTRPVEGFAVGRGLSAVLRACGPHGSAAGHRPGVRVASDLRGAPRPATAPLGSRRVWAATRPSGLIARARPLVGPPTPTALCGVDEPEGDRSRQTVPPPVVSPVSGPEAVDRAVRRRFYGGVWRKPSFGAHADARRFTQQLKIYELLHEFLQALLVGFLGEDAVREVPSMAERTSLIASTIAAKAGPEGASVVPRPHCGCVSMRVSMRSPGAQPLVCIASALTISVQSPRIPRHC